MATLFLLLEYYECLCIKDVTLPGLAGGAIHCEVKDQKQRLPERASRAPRMAGKVFLRGRARRPENGFQRRSKRRLAEGNTGSVSQASAADVMLLAI